MSRAIAPPRPGAPGAADALFAEARRRRRRRRLAGLAVILALAAAAAVAFILARPGGAPAVRAGRARGGPLTGSVAWVDYNGRLHLGDLATGRSVSPREARPIRPFPWSRPVAASTGPPRRVPATWSRS